MSNTAILEGLDQASRKHEKDIVVEFGTDRFLHTLGVHFLILLAIVAKVTEVAAGKKSSCYCAAGERKYGKSFILYANVYCWESYDISAPSSSNNTSCANLTNRFDDLRLISDATFIKSFVQWLPYVMLIEAFLLSLPSAWWHFRVGSRLVGHLKFVELLLGDIYKSIKDIPAGIYRRSETRETTRQDRVRCCTGCKCGGMTDRDMFSLLCHENFSSLMYQPYVASIFELTYAKKGQDTPRRPDPLKSTILQHWCHQNNFAGNVIVASYEKKHLLGIGLSTAALAVLLIITCFVGKNGWGSSIFLCDVIYHGNACLLCTVPRMTESVGYLLIMLVMTVSYLAISLWRLLTFNMKELLPPDFLNNSSDGNSFALLAAYKKSFENEEQKAEEKSVDNRGSHEVNPPGGQRV